MPTTTADVLASVLRDPGRPRLTWYGDPGERVELSGAVLDNWVAKTANLLVEELDAGPGTTVLVDLPPHWRAVVWALAAWRVGATVVAPGAAGPAVDVLVSDRPAEASPGADAVVAVALPALARSFDAPLPSGALDAASSVMTYADVIGWAPPVDPASAALVTAGGDAVGHADLLASAATAAPVEPGSRTLLPVDEDRAATGAVLLAALGVLAADGSVVLLRAGDGGRTERVVADERVTARLSPA